MQENCVFCGADIPAGALYCQDCAQIVENMTDDQRRALAAMLDDEKALCTFCQAWEQIKECMAIIWDFAKYVAACVVGIFVETENEQEEG
jgi:predicted nucleic acid-binding Zn ribbon protein